MLLTGREEKSLFWNIPEHSVFLNSICSQVLQVLEPLRILSEPNRPGDKGEEGKYSTPAGSNHLSVPPKEVGVGVDWEALAVRGIGLTKRLRPNYRTYYLKLPLQPPYHYCFTASIASSLQTVRMWQKWALAHCTGPKWRMWPWYCNKGQK